VLPKVKGTRRIHSRRELFINALFEVGLESLAVDHQKPRQPVHCVAGTRLLVPAFFARVLKKVVRKKIVQELRKVYACVVIRHLCRSSRKLPIEV
jgi:hypothetical protein